MTSPDGAKPTKAVTYAQISAMQNYDPAIAAGVGNGDITGLANAARGNLLTNILGGFIGGIAQLISSLFSGIFGGGGGGGGGGILDLIGGFLGIRNDITDVREVEIPRLDNRIDDVSSGGVSAVRASFFQDGTWTKPVGYSRHVVVVIGAASGGGRGNGGFGSGFGGYSGGRNDFEFFDSDLPATVNCQIGIGGLGATADNQPGAPGGQTNFGTYGAAGGALATDFGFGAKTRQLRGGYGGAFFANSNIPATAGTGTDFANGGAAATGTAGAAGGDGNRPTPNTLAEYGTGGGGGARSGGTGNGGRGGNGAVPGGPGGGGGTFAAFGFKGNGGNGADGAIFITSYK